jgi:hypothetical protein
MRLKHRLLKLERMQVPPTHVQLVALDVPGSPDLMFCGGEWKEIPDGIAVLKAHPGQPIKVYRSIDVREV